MTANCLASTEFVAMLFIFDLERDPTVFTSIKCFREAIGGCKFHPNMPIWHKEQSNQKTIEGEGLNVIPLRCFALRNTFQIDRDYNLACFTLLFFSL